MSLERDCFPVGSVCGWCEQEMSLLRARVMLDAPREAVLRSQLQGMMGKHNSR